MTYRNLVAATIVVTVCIFVGQTRWPSDTAASVAAAFAVVAVDFALAAAPSVEPGLTVEGFVVALTAVAFVAIGSTIATSTAGLSSLAILGTRSFTIPIRITDTIPTDIILTVTDTILTINLFTKAAVDIPIL